MKRRKTSNGKRIDTAHLVAKLAISPATLRVWISKGLPVAKRGRGAGRSNEFELAGVMAWVEKHRSSLTSQKSTDLDAPATKADADLALTLQKIRSARANATKAELELAARRSALLDAAEVEAGRVRRIAVVKAGLLGLPGKIAPLCVGRDIREIETQIVAEVRRLLEEYSS